MRDDPSVTDLVTRASNGEKQAWDALVERHSPLVWSICRRHGLSGADASDVGQSVWLQLAGQLDQLRAPAALPGWLARVAVRECRRARCAARLAPGAGPMPDAEGFPEDPAGVAEHELAMAERHTALLDAFAQLPACDQRLMLLLVEDPAMPRAQISAKLGIPVEDIGPARHRCLGMLRRHPAVAAMTGADAGRPG